MKSFTGIKAVRLNNDAHGKRVYRVPVIVHFNNSVTFDTDELRLDVISHSATEAANYVRDLVAQRPETEVYAFGPSGGQVYRYVGWESSIGAMLLAPRAGGEQLTINLVDPLS